MAERKRRGADAPHTLETNHFPSAFRLLKGDEAYLRGKGGLGYENSVFGKDCGLATSDL